MNRFLDPVQHAVQRRRQLPYFVVSTAARHSLAQVGLTNPRSGLRNLTHIEQHPPRGEKHDRESQHNIQQPQQQKTNPEIPQHPQLVPLREAEINMAPVIHGHGRHPERGLRILYAQIERSIGHNFVTADGIELLPAIPGSHPKRRRPICSCLQEEHRVIGATSRTPFVGHLPARELGDLPYDAAIQTILWRPPCHIAQDLDFS